VRKISPPPGFDPQTVQPVASRYTEYVTRPTQSLLPMAENCEPGSRISILIHIPLIISIIQAISSLLLGSNQSAIQWVSGPNQSFASSKL